MFESIVAKNHVPVHILQKKMTKRWAETFTALEKCDMERGYHFFLNDCSLFWIHTEMGAGIQSHRDGCRDSERVMSKLCISSTT